jgi:hypothetical protein
LSEISAAEDRDLVAFAWAMASAADWSAGQAIDFFAWPQKHEREYAAWVLLGQPCRDDDPGWDRFVELVLGSEGRLREFLLEAEA